MIITVGTNSTPPFFFVSDTYTAGEVKRTIIANCANVTVGDPTPLNSTGNLYAGGVVQLYRGDSAAILLQGYDNTKELTGNSTPVPNPPLPPSINMSIWTCLNGTIGESIPLTSGTSSFPQWGIALCVLLPLLFFCCCCVCSHSGDDDDDDDE